MAAAPQVGLCVRAAEFVKTVPDHVIPSPFALPLRTALSAAKGLRVNSARNLLFAFQRPTRFLVA
jgi:hypothetical protein